MVFESSGVQMVYRNSPSNVGEIERNYLVLTPGQSKIFFSASFGFVILVFSFNRLDLPPYENYTELRLKLVQAMEMSEAFDGVD